MSSDRGALESKISPAIPPVRSDRADRGARDAHPSAARGLDVRLDSRGSDDRDRCRRDPRSVVAPAALDVHRPPARLLRRRRSAASRQRRLRVRLCTSRPAPRGLDRPEPRATGGRGSESQSERRCSCFRSSSATRRAIQRASGDGPCCGLLSPRSSATPWSRSCAPSARRHARRATTSERSPRSPT